MAREFTFQAHCMCREPASLQALTCMPLRLLLFRCRSVAGKALVTLLKVGAEGETTAIVASEQVSYLTSQLVCLVILPSSRARFVIVGRRSGMYMGGPKAPAPLPVSASVSAWRWLCMFCQWGGQPVPGLALLCPC